MRIDAHQHYWKVDRGDYGWLTPELDVLYRDYLPEDLLPQLDSAGIDGTILVQAAPTVAETEFMLELAADEARIVGVVGWLDFEDDGFADELARLKRSDRFVGLRPMLQDLDDDRWILRPKVLEHLKVMAAEGVPIDFLTHPRHLPHVVTVLERIPGLRGVVDHLSKPPIASGRLDPWRQDLAAVAQHPQVMCKLSGMVTEADPEAWRPEDLKPYVDHVLDVFGVDRVMYGSDWPVCLMAASYQEVYEALRTVLGGRLTPEMDRAVFGENAARFYGVGGR